MFYFVLDFVEHVALDSLAPLVDLTCHVTHCPSQVGAESIIEMSTLTGAMMVSLGKEICGFFTTDDALAKELEDVSKKTGDKVSQEQFLLCDYFHCYLSQGFPSDTCFFPIILFTTTELENAHGKGIQ